MAAYLSKCSVIYSIAKTLLVYINKNWYSNRSGAIVKKILDIMHC